MVETEGYYEFYNDAEDILTQKMILIDDKYTQKTVSDEWEFDVDGSIEAFLYKNEEGEAGNQLRTIRAYYRRFVREFCKN